MTKLLESSAVFSDCRAYRYLLVRRWNAGPLVNFCLLNPSTADEKVNDPTVTRCIKRAEMWGYGGVVVTNLFAYRATVPSALLEVTDPIGPWNNRHILRSAKMAALVVLGWGVNGKLMDRGNAVRALLRDLGDKPVCCLRLNDDGQPGHPLYLPYAAKLHILGGSKDFVQDSLFA